VIGAEVVNVLQRERIARHRYRIDCNGSGGVFLGCEQRLVVVENRDRAGEGTAEWSATRSAQRNVDILRAFDHAVVDDRHAEILDGLAGGELKRAGRGEIVGGGLGGAVTRREVDRQRIQDAADARDRDGSAARVFIDDVVRRRELHADGREG